MPVKIYKRGEVYHYRGTVAGRRIRGTTGTASKEIAQQIANREEALAWKSDLNGPEAVLTFADAAVLYRRAGKSERFLARIEDYWKDTLVKNINAGAIRQSALDLYPKASAATRNRQAIVPTQAIINHCAEAELCPIVRVKRFKVEKKEKTPVSWEWIQTFAAHNKPHLGALAMFMFLTGARISEALAVTWKDINLRKRTVLIRQTKIGEERTAHLPPALFAALANLPRDRAPFQYANRNDVIMVWRRACKRAGIEVLSFHACRHGFATTLLQSGVDVVTVAKRGGWKTPRHVFETYGHANEDRTVTDRLTGTQVAQFHSDDEEMPVISA
jgi:integrase